MWSKLKEGVAAADPVQNTHTANLCVHKVQGVVQEWTKGLLTTFSGFCTHSDDTILVGSLPPNGYFLAPDGYLPALHFSLHCRPGLYTAYHDYLPVPHGHLPVPYGILPVWLPPCTPWL